MTHFSRLVVPVTVAVVALAAFGADEAKPPAKGDLGVIKEFVYKKLPGCELKLYVHLPDGWKKTDKRPGIIFFFGGGWTGGTPTQFLPQAIYLSRRGMVCARADYRVKSRHRVTPDTCVEDAKSALRWFRSHAGELGLDPDRIVASGGSAGGHLAACTGTTEGLDAKGEDTKVSARPQAMVLFNPALNFVGVDKLMQRLGEAKDRAEAISPTQNLKKDTAPALLLFGTKDFLLDQGKQWMARAKELGHKSELYLADGQSHGFFNRPPWLERTLIRTDAFLTKLGYLEGPCTMKEGYFDALKDQLRRARPPKKRQPRRRTQ